MQREPLTRRQDPRRERITQTQPVRERAERVQPDMSHDLGATGSHHHRNHAVTVHLAGALLVRLLDASITPESLATRAPSRMGPDQLTRSRE